MNPLQSNSDDAKLAALLRQSRPAPPLPPRFQEGVWGRIERGDRAASGPVFDGLDRFIAWVLRPRLALAAASALAIAGVLLGAVDGTRAARRDAENHYLTAVAPESLR
jgi:hypothetical protein